MKKPVIPSNEAERLEALYSYDMLDSTSEEIFDNITWIASLVCNAPMSFITLVDRDRQWFKSAEGLDIKETSRDVSFCSHAINDEGMMEVSDATEDERFNDNPLVTGEPKIRFYAGIPLVNPEQFKLGALCVIDRSPKTLTALQKDILQRLSQIVMALFEAKRVAIAQIREHEESELILKETGAKLEKGLHAMEQRNREMGLLTEVTSILQSCLTEEEACVSLTTYCKQLFPDAHGTLSLLQNARGTLQTMVSWGHENSQKSFATNDCWALRRSQYYQVDDTSQGLVCKHLPGHSEGEKYSSLCVPMMAQGETMGLLCLEFPHPADTKEEESFSHNQSILAIAVAEQSALALANIRLRQTLHSQSNSDALTGLNNRRFLSEEFNNILADATAGNKPVSVILIDVDHFKTINDTLGHEAGDMVLQKMSEVFRDFVRQNDIVCRLGGDEFLVVMPDVSLDKACTRAEELRAAVSQIKINKDGFPITVSLGVADFPAHGNTAEKLIQSADEALYKAKEAGRNKTMPSE
jgi:diguanylate cyclase (GGDEF)-like protein